jgi:hypothetical protein
MMSLDAVIARIGAIETAQQQMVDPTAATTAASSASSAASMATGAVSGATGGTTLGATGTGATGSFASALSSAQTAGVPSTAGPVQGAIVPQTSWNPQHKPIAAWIAPVLQWASQHGWSGSVTSGYRSYQQQASLNSQGLYSAPAGRSNHETTTYPGGAVDVSDPSQLIQVLKGYTGPQKLVGGVLGSVDPEHFSATGH